MWGNITLILNFRSEESLGEAMERFHIPGIFGVDTRRLARDIRTFGSRKVLLTDISASKEQCLKLLKETKLPRDVVAQVSVKKSYQTGRKDAAFHVAAIDCGMKKSIVRSLEKRGCAVTVVPYHTTAEELEALKPDGIFISNGPGNPEDVPGLIETVRALHGRYPLFGICLGHQILCLSYGAACYKLKFGHRGGNHPVKNLLTGRVEITAQNHSYAVLEESLSGTPLAVTHRNLLDHTVEGVCCQRDHAFSVQYHPESAPGPEDSSYLFDQFIELMEEGRKDA